MSFLLQLLGSVAVFVGGLIVMFLGALGNSVATYFLGMGVAAVGVIALALTVAVALGYSIPYF